MADTDAMKRYNPLTIASALDPFDFHEFAPFNSASFAVFHGTGGGTSDWEIHRDTDEFLFVLEGSVTVEILTDSDSQLIPLTPGEFIVVAAGHWHRHVNVMNLTELYFTPGSSEQSDAADPRAR